MNFPFFMGIDLTSSSRRASACALLDSDAQVLGLDLLSEDAESWLLCCVTDHAMSPSMRPSDFPWASAA